MAIFWLRSIRSGMTLPNLPLASKCVSVKNCVNPKALTLPPFSLYCKDKVPFLVSASPVPFTPPSLICLGARPIEFEKYKCPNDPPNPKVV